MATSTAVSERAGTGAVVPRLSGVNESALDAAYAECARITQTRARNFFYGLRLTPEPRRSAIYSIYTWMRAADDEADAPEPASVRRDRLALFRARTERIIGGQVPASADPAWWTAFAATMASYPIDPQICCDMLDGLDEDLESNGYADDAALGRYCYRVAGTAGLACLWIWGLREGADPAKAREFALRRGQAFQRTNILRDFAEDFDESPRRVYLPREAFTRHGITPEDVRAWSKPEACTAFISEQAKLTREHYTASAELESMIDPTCRATLWAMTRIYSGLLSVIEAEPARIVSEKRIRLAGAKKASIALSAAIWARVGRW